MTDYTDLNRFDAEVLEGIILEHLASAAREPANSDWYLADVRRIEQHLEARRGLNAESA